MAPMYSSTVPVSLSHLSPANMASEDFASPPVRCSKSHSPSSISSEESEKWDSLLKAKDDLIRQKDEIIDR